MSKLSSSRTSSAPRPTGDVNLRIFTPLARWVSEKHGERKLEEIAAAAGLNGIEFDGKSHWTGLESFEEFLRGVRELAGSDEEFQRACVHRMSESYGVFRLLLRAVSPLAVFKKAIDQMSLISRISQYEVVASGGTFLEWRYVSKKKESRLSCLSRQAQGAILPTLWGLPRARVTERKCIAFGDDCCELRYQWYEHRRLLPTLIGLVAGGAAGAALAWLGLVAWPFGLVLPIIGGLIGYALELRRTDRENLRIGEEMNAALGSLAVEDAEARREVLALHQRQKEWTRVLEEQVAERTAVMEDVVRRLQDLNENLRTNVRGLSHDLHNPMLSILHLNEQIQARCAAEGQGLVELAREQRSSIEHMEIMFRDLMGVLRAGTPLLRLAPQPVETAPLLDQLRRRARALVIGREIRVSALATRETPTGLETDLLLLNRVIDNLLTNAAKYTERGSIVIELDGKPGFFTIKVSDTGRGIAEEDVRRIFEPGGSPEDERAVGSYGVGLSVVVRLLAQIGGRLEVMSLPGVGTTFWAHFPVEIRKQEPESGEGDGHAGGDAMLLDKVVTIHRSNTR